MEKKTVYQWHVFAWGTKFKHKLNPNGFYHDDQWFTSKEAAEDYAKNLFGNLFGIEKWEVKEMIFTEEEARQEEEIVQIMARWKKQIEDREDKESRKKPTNLQ